MVRKRGPVEEGLYLLNKVTRWLSQHAAVADSQMRMAEIFSSARMALRERHLALLRAARAHTPADYDTEGLLAARSILSRLTGRDDDDAVIHLLALECLVRSFYVSETTYQRRATAYRRMATILGAFKRCHQISPGVALALTPIIEDLRDVGLETIAHELECDPVR